MKTHFLLPILLLSFVTLVITSSCTDDNFSVDKSGPSEKEIKSRTCETGTYTEDDGRIVFDDYDEFDKTVQFVTCGSKEDIDEWQGELEIITSYKAYSELNSLIDEETDNGKFEELLEQYDGMVNISYNNDTVSFSPLFKIFNEICNLDGEFGIGTAVIKITTDKIISIGDPNAVSPSTVNNSTTTDTTNKLFTYLLEPGSIGFGCCPYVDDETIYYGSSPRLKSKVRYRLFNASIILPNPIFSGYYDFYAAVHFDVDGITYKRKCFILCSWIENKNQTLSLDLDGSISHNYGTYGITSPITFDELYDHLGGSQIYHDVRRTHKSTHFALFRIPELGACVNESYDSFTHHNPDPDKTVTIDCN